MNATVLSHATIGREALVAAGALVRERQVVEPLTHVAGVPARPRGTVDAPPGPDASRWYRENARRYAAAGIGLGRPPGVAARALGPTREAGPSGEAHGRRPHAPASSDM